jgi:hypothetical protein
MYGWRPAPIDILASDRRCVMAACASPQESKRQSLVTRAASHLIDGENGLRAGRLQCRLSMHADGAGPAHGPQGPTPSQMAALLPCQPSEQKATKDDEKNIGNPHEQFRVRMGIPTQRVANDNKEKVGGRYDQTHGEPD